MRKTKAHPRRKRKCCGGDNTPLRDDDGQSELGISRRAAGVRSRTGKRERRERDC